MPCSCDDEPADVWNEHQRRARKPHVCYECDEPIEVGESYTVMSWCVRGEGWSSTKVCEFCMHDWDYLRDQGHCVSTGELKEAWREHWLEPKLLWKRPALL